MSSGVYFWFEGLAPETSLALLAVCSFFEPVSKKPSGIGRGPTAARAAASCPFL